jgi:hypothetical protein
VMDFDSHSHEWMDKVMIFISNLPRGRFSFIC